ncbi:MAG: hypothetical protein U9R25_16680 [Chloroflexota bacterium]|nr:hypothetical protein [Chloroflexota bacterium]
MLSRRITHIVPAIMALVLLLIAVMPALAGPPDHETTPISDVFLLAECDGFNVMDAVEGTRQSTTFYDQEGEPVRILDHNRARDRIYNTESGFEVHSRWAQNVKYYAPFDTWGTTSGLGWNVTVPGYGSVWFEAGHCTYDSELGEASCTGHRVYDEAALCEAMDQ